jgi:signal transduction histidine kinase/ligand-binding sensor domain-containing protein
LSCEHSVARARWAALCCGLCILLFPGLNAFAEGDDWTRLTQYRHRVWKISDGWFDGNILALAQGPDGYLWMGTQLGLLRFDGVRFSAWPVPQGHQPMQRVKLLLASRDGAMWIVSNLGLSVYKNNQLSDVPLSGASIQSLYEDREGNVWATRAKLKIGQLPLCKVSVQPAKCFGPDDGLKLRYTTRITEDSDGYFWVGGGQLVRWKPGTAQTEYFGEALNAFGNSSGVSALLSLSDGSVLAGLGAPGENAGLQQFAQGEWHSVKARGFDGGVSGGETLFQDREGAIWLAPFDSGLVHLKNGRADTFVGADGLSGDEVIQIIQDAEGTVWTATNHGLDNFSRVPVISYTVREGKPLGPASSVAARSDGSVFVAATQPFSIKDGDAKALPGFERMAREGEVESVMIDSAQNAWVAKGNQLYLYRDGLAKPVKTPGGSDRLLVGEIMPALVEDAQHTVWGLITGNGRRRLVTITAEGMKEVSDLPNADIGYSLALDHSGGLWIAGGSTRLNHFNDGKIATQVIGDSNPDFAARDLFVDASNKLWVVSNQGVRVLRDGIWSSLGKANGLPCTSLDSGMIDRDQTLWLDGLCGLFRIEHNEWTKALDSPGAKMAVRQLGPSDGWNIGFIDAWPRITQTLDGKLWFAGPDLQMVEPNGVDHKFVSPPAHIEQVVVDRKAYDFDALTHIPPNPRELEIDYTAPSSLNPRSIKFQYRLLGHDESWQDPGIRRQAFYTDLPPGRYRFEVMVGDNVGPSSMRRSDSIEFIVTPAFYQTWWFRTFCAIMIALALWAAYAARLSRVTGALRRRHQERLTERESIARDLHDTFFQSVQSLFLRLHTAAQKLPVNESTRDTLERVLDDSDRVMLQGRQVMLDLRAESSKTTTLANALAVAGNDLQTAYPCEFRVTVSGDPRPLIPLVFEEMRRFGHEALSNAFRHAKAKLIEVEIHYERSEFKVRVRDDGIGIDAEVLNPGFRHGHWGLPGMRERAAKIGGRLDIWSRAEAGTEIELHLPAGAAYIAKSEQAKFARWAGSSE